MPAGDPADLDDYGDWKAKVDEFLGGKKETTIQEIMAAVFNIPPGQKNIGQSARISKYIASLGWTPSDPDAKSNKLYVLMPEDPGREPRESRVPPVAKYMNFDSSGDMVMDHTITKMVREHFEAADDKNIARFALSILCLLRLLTGDVFSRRDLFADSSDLPTPNRFLKKERATKDWQRALLYKMGERKMLAKTVAGRDPLFAMVPEKRDDFAGMVSNALSGDGTGLKAMLWPRMYDSPEGEEESEEEAADEQDAEPEQDAEMSVLSEVAAQLGAAAEALGSVLQALQELERRSSESLSEIKTLQETQRGTVDSMKDIGERLSSMLDEMRRSEATSLAAVRDRLTEGISRKKSLLNQISSEDRREDSVLEALNEILERLGGRDGHG